MSSVTEEYASIINGFKQEIVCYDTDICVKEKNIPECCSYGDGRRLTFTEKEFEIINELYDVVEEVFNIEYWYDPYLECEMKLYYMSIETNNRIFDECFNGWTSRTLECVSHPTRPVIGLSKDVIGVANVIVDGKFCGLKNYDREKICELWKRALSLIGMKPYYCYYNIKKTWVVL